LRLTIALAGNPNAGKTSLFNALTGAHQHVGNYPGVTVEKKTGRARLDQLEFEVVDLPGTYSLTHYSLEERVARDFLIKERPDVVIDIVDASNLERHLNLTIQLLELGVPVVIALNMVDVAARRGLVIDHDKLSELLGAPVVPTVARMGRGKEEVLRAAAQAASLNEPWQSKDLTYGHDVDEVLLELTGQIEASSLESDFPPARWLAIKRLEGDPLATRTLAADAELAAAADRLVDTLADHIRRTTGDPIEAIIADHRYGFLSGLTRRVVKTGGPDRLRFTDALDRLLTHPLVGPVVMVAVIYGLFLFVFRLGEYPVGWIEAGFGWAKLGVEAVLPEGLLRSLLVSGIIDGVGGVISFAPLIMLMFFGIAVIEDSGYLARMAYMLDRILRVFGLHGGSTLALIVSGGISGGCAVPGVMATRTLRAPKERLATILVAPFMTCGAKLPVFALLIGAFFPKNPALVMMIVVLLSWVLALSAAWVLRHTVLRGESAPFVMELPPYRRPTLRGLYLHTWERTWLYVRKAGTWILAVAVILWALMTFPRLPADQARAMSVRLEAGAAAGLVTGAAMIRPGPLEAASVAAALDLYKRDRAAVSSHLAGEALRHSLAGRIGLGLESATRPLGLNWQTNIALIGGFAAKEVIVSTLGTAYSLGGDDSATSLASRLRRDKQWNPLVAMTLMIFIILYVPCFVTVLTIRHEAGTRWALFAMAYTLVTAYLVALTVYQAGRLLGWGLT
jgi:ferrous iron transport protein B